jgi:coenzyme F420-reducing hydrogenase gamma subunit
MYEYYVVFSAGMVLSPSSDRVSITDGFFMPMKGCPPQKEDIVTVRETIQQKINEDRAGTGVELVDVTVISWQYMGIYEDKKDKVEKVLYDRTLPR